jgi:hypothetical protein
MTSRWAVFFTWIWRINGLLILGLSSIGFVAACAMIFDIGVFSSQHRTDDEVKSIAGTDLSAENLRIGEFREIRGTTFLYARLAAPTQYIGSGSSDAGVGEARNLLFFDTTTKAAHWLLPSNNQRILGFSFITDTPRSDDCEYRRNERCAVQAILVELDPTTERDETSSAKRTVAVASSDGRNLTTVASNVDALLGHHLVARNSLIAFYSASGAVKVLEIDPVSHETRSDIVLSTRADQ